MVITVWSSCVLTLLITENLAVRGVAVVDHHEAVVGLQRDACRREIAGRPEHALVRVDSRE